MLKRLFFLSLLLLMIGGGVLFYMGNRATSVPDWFDPDLTLSEIADDSGLTETLAQLAEPTTVARTETRSVVPDPPTESIRQAQPTEPAGNSGQTTAPQRTDSFNHGNPPKVPAELQLDEPQLNALLLRGLESRPDGRRARRATKVIQVNLLADRMAVGGVTNIEKLLEATESDRERAAIQRLTRLAPFIKGRDFYLGIEGRPAARNGKLAFDDMTVKVGQLSFDPQQLAERFGLEDKLAKQEMAVRLPDLNLESVRIEDENLLLSLVQ